MFSQKIRYRASILLTIIPLLLFFPIWAEAQRRGTLSTVLAIGFRVLRTGNAIYRLYTAGKFIVDLFDSGAHPSGGNYSYIPAPPYGKSPASSAAKMDPVRTKTVVRIGPDSHMPGESIRQKYAGADFWDHDQILLASGDRLDIQANGALIFTGHCVTKADGAGVFKNEKQCKENTELLWTDPGFQGYMYLHTYDQSLAIWDSGDNLALIIETDYLNETIHVILEDSLVGSQAFKALFGVALEEALQ